MDLIPNRWAIRRWPMSLLVLTAAAAACSPANNGVWTRPETGRPAPQASFPMSSEQVGAQRIAPALPGRVLLHTVAIDAPDTSRVMIGRMRFASPESFTLVAMAQIGMTLFEVTVSPDKTGAANSGNLRIESDVAKPLQGRFPVDRLARDLAWTYLPVCAESAYEPASGASSEVKTGSAYRRRCETEGIQVEEWLDGATVAPIRRVVTEPDGRQLTIEYAEWGWWSERWHPRRITIREIPASLPRGTTVTIVLSGVERE